MSLFSCPECQHQISTAAEACPHCGYPVRERSTGGTGGSSCCACSSPATTRCQCCGALSCVDHVRSVNVWGNRGGYELRCESCAGKAEDSNALSAMILVIAVIIIIFVALSGGFSSKSSSRSPAYRHGHAHPTPALQIEV